MFEQLPRPTIFAHRGASAYAPENTLPAFELAVRQNADAIELDATLTGDDHVVVFHDDSIDRTTDGQGRIKDLSLAAIRELDAGSFFDESFRGVGIPTLEEVFETVGDKTIINIEIKNYASPFDALPELIAKLITHHNLADRVLFSSFNPLALNRIHKLLPGIPIGLLIVPGLGGRLVRSMFGSWIPHQALHPPLQNVSRHLIQNQHRLGRRVHAYTVNHPEDMIRLFEWDVDGIFTDDPLVARQTLEGIQKVEVPTQ